MNIRQVVLLMIALLFTANSVYAKDLNSPRLKSAQEALSSGDYEEAFADYSLIAEEDDNPLAKLSVGLFLQNGWGRPVNREAACQWFEKSARGNIPVALHLFAECIEKGVHRTADPALAAVWYAKAAEYGHHTSLCSLAELYMTGNGVPKNPAKALELCRKSAGIGSLQSAISLGRFYLEGDESIRDYQAAIQWFEYAAEKNDPEARYYLGVIVRDGHAGAMKPGTDRYFFELAASQHYVPAYFQTGKLYFNAPVDPKTGWLSEDALAKAYLWLSATVKRSEDREELAEAEEMLKKIREVMPKTWGPELDQKVAHHLRSVEG